MDMKPSQRPPEPERDALGALLATEWGLAVLTQMAMSYLAHEVGHPLMPDKHPPTLGTISRSASLLVRFTAQAPWNNESGVRRCLGALVDTSQDFRRMRGLYDLTDSEIAARDLEDAKLVGASKLALLLETIHTALFTLEATSPLAVESLSIATDRLCRLPGMLLSGDFDSVAEELAELVEDDQEQRCALEVWLGSTPS